MANETLEHRKKDDVDVKALLADDGGPDDASDHWNKPNNGEPEWTYDQVLRMADKMQPKGEKSTGMPVGMGQPVEHAAKGGGFWDSAQSTILDGLESWTGF